MLEKSKMVRKCQSTVTSHCRLSVFSDNLHLRVGDLPLHVLRILLAGRTPGDQPDGSVPADPGQARARGVPCLFACLFFGQLVIPLPHD